MNGETDVLQHRVEVLPFRRRRIEPQERIRGEDDEGEEGHGDQALNAEHARLQSRRQAVPEKRHKSAEDREDEGPEKHRAFMIAPDARDLENERDGRMGILGDRGYGKI